MDLPALAAYCIAFGEVLEMSTLIAKAGRLNVDPKIVRARDDALKTMHRFMIEFGMTPASRSRVRMDRQPQSDLPPDEAFLQARGLRVVK